MARIKGTALVNVVKALRAVAKEHAVHLVAEPLQHYLRERILPSSWYPEEDHLGLLKALAGQLQAAADAKREDVFIWMGRNAAQADMATIYASLVAASTPESIFRRGATLWQSYHDTGTLRVTMTDAHQGHVELAGYGLSSPEMCRLTTGWFMGFLEVGGAKDVRVVETRCRHRGAPSCVWDVEWR